MASEENFFTDQIISLSELTKEQFLELLSSDNEFARRYRRYAKLEFTFRKKSYEQINLMFKKI